MGGQAQNQQDKFEAVLKKRKQKTQADVLRAQKAAKKVKSSRRRALKQMKFVRAERLVKDARRAAADRVRLRAVVKNPRRISIKEDNTLLLAVRLKGVKGTTPKVRKVLSMLRLTKPNSAVFLSATPRTIKLLQQVEPFIAYGQPTLKTVRDLIYKHGRGTVDKKSVPLSDNLLIEKALGEHNIICLEDIVHEIASVGKAFRVAAKFLQPFKLKRPPGNWKQEARRFFEDDELGWCQDKINSLVEKMC